MTPVISIVGKSGSGKTTLIEALVAELKARGRRVAVIKHSEGFELDTEGKDTWRFSRAGSEAVAISSPSRFALIEKTGRDLGIREAAERVGTGFDIVLTEGFKKSPAPKIEVHRREQGAELLTPPEQLVAVVTDEVLEVKVPQLSPGDTKAVADVIEKTAAEEARRLELEISVNGSALAVDPRTQDVISRTLIAMMLGVRGVDGVISLRINMRR